MYLLYYNDQYRLRILMMIIERRLDTLYLAVVIKTNSCLIPSLSLFLFSLVSSFFHSPYSLYFLISSLSQSSLSSLSSFLFHLLPLNIPLSKLFVFLRSFFLNLLMISLNLITLFRHFPDLFILSLPLFIFLFIHPLPSVLFFSLLFYPYSSLVTPVFIS